MKSTQGKSKLMAIDDEPDITFTLKNMLERNGFLVDTINDVQVALSKFKPYYYDLLLLDVDMPQMNGLELYREIKKKENMVKACFFTGSAIFETLKKRYPDLMARCYIRKPVDLESLVKRINEELVTNN